MKSDFPEFACPYAQRLAARSRRFARQVYDPPKARESADDGYSLDPFGERLSPCPGLLQRFPDRVLVMTAKRCFMNCRHCTRRGLLAEAAVVETPAQLEKCLAYVKARPKVRDVLLSGGDILTRPDREVLRFVSAFAALPQIDLIRVCTRALAANPARVTARLARALGRSKKVWVNTQFNCADEVTDEARAAAARLVEAGVPVSSQSVLLKGVNDSACELVKLFRALSAARIRPYYVFQCDPVAGLSHFRVPLEKALALERACARRVGGLSLPRFVADVPGADRKIPLAELAAYESNTERP